ncbi:MAG: translation initiation factor IF-2 N-terminal domain-containing protein, partial [Polyangiales bacterium]
MSKVRVYEVARELGVENRDLIQRIATLGIQVRNHMSVLDPVEVDRIKRSLGKNRTEAMVEERIRPTVVRRKRRKQPDESEPAVAAAPVAGPTEASTVDFSATAPVHASEPDFVPEPIRSEGPVAADSAPPVTPTGELPPEPRMTEPPPAAEISEPPPVSEEQGRFSHDPLPPGVMRRGKAKAPSATPLS